MSWELLVKNLNTSNYCACSRGVLSRINDIDGVASSFQQLSSGGDRGSRMVFAGERGGGRNATAAKSLK